MVAVSEYDKGHDVNNMRYFWSIGKIIVASVISIILLSAFSYVYSFSGVHLYNESGATDYKWSPYQYKANMTEGFSWLRMDEDGFNNERIPVGEVNILLLGSSHMEAVNVEPNENVGYLLNEMMPDKYTYNIGMSGHTIYTCVQNLENALKEYEPTEYVIIETDTIHLDTESVEAVISNSYPEIPSYDSGWQYLIQKNIPVIKQIYKQLDAWRSQDTGTDGVISVDESGSALNDELTRSFLHEIMAAATERDVKPVLMYHPAVMIGAGGDDVVIPDEKEYRDCFADFCADEGIVFVDMTDDFVSLYKEKHVLAHGFVNTGVGAGHLNRYGHEVIAERLAQVIERDDYVN